MTVSYEQLLDDIYSAYLQARKHKRNKRSQLMFEYSLESELASLRDEIWERRYSPSKADCFVVRDPVLREIYSSQFRDRVVHHLLYNYISPFFEERFIHDSYSCRIGKGTGAGITRLSHHIRSCSENYTKESYILKLDIRNYFASIDQEKLYQRIMHELHKGKDDIFDMELVSFLLRVIIFRDPAANANYIGPASLRKELPPLKSLRNAPEGIGLPIGDLTSQLFSNIYLDSFDQWIKREMHIKHYGRYVDDFYIVHRDRAVLESLIPCIAGFLKSELGLTLHPAKIVLCRARDSIEFLGALLSPYCIRPSRRCVSSFKSEIHKIDMAEANSMQGRKSNIARLNARLGYVAQFRTFRLRSNVILNTRYIKNHYSFPVSYKLARFRSASQCELWQEYCNDFIVTTTALEFE